MTHVSYEEPRIFQPGAPFRDHYVVEDFLGAGASGQVYGLRHRFTGDRFAVKVGHLKDRGNAKKVARSLVEAQATYGLRHPNVVKVFDLACEDDGMVWQLMERLEGCPVGTMLAKDGRFSPLYALDVALEVAWGLQAAHEQQIIHRDVHPFNVFVTSAGQVKVLDFSLAKVLPSGLQTTCGSRAMGTMGFMAPEYMKGGVVTPQLDVYALGILLWQMLVGRNPFLTAGVNLAELVRRQLEEEPASLVTEAGLPGYCDEVLRGATAKDPARRYEGMWALAQAMLWLRERLLADPEAEVLRRYSAPERRRPIVQDTAGYARHAALRSLPGAVTAPPIPSARLVVAPGMVVAAVEARRVVAKTAPMEVVTERRSAPTLIGGPPVVPAGVVAREVDVGAPTVRGRPRAPARAVWVAVVAAVVVTIGLLAWLLVGMVMPAGRGASIAPHPPAELGAGR